MNDQEFGEMKARLDGLRGDFLDFRDESRRAQSEYRGLVTQLADRLHHRLGEHSRRLHGLERWRSYLTGGLAALAATLAFGRWVLGMLFPGARG